MPCSFGERQHFDLARFQDEKETGSVAEGTIRGGHRFKHFDVLALIVRRTIVESPCVMLLDFDHAEVLRIRTAPVKNKVGRATMIGDDFRIVRRDDLGVLRFAVPIVFKVPFWRFIQIVVVPPILMPKMSREIGHQTALADIGDEQIRIVTVEVFNGFPEVFPDPVQLGLSICETAQNCGGIRKGNGLRRRTPAAWRGGSGADWAEMTGGWFHYSLFRFVQCKSAPLLPVRRAEARRVSRCREAAQPPRGID